MTKSKTCADQEVQIDRRRPGIVKEGNEGQSQSVNAEVKTPRRKKQRRRQIDPTTCERDYNDDEIRFMQAMDAYKRSSGRMFPTCSEVLEVIRDLGYVKLTPEEQQLLTSIADVETEMAQAIEGTESTLDEEIEASLA